MKISFNCIPNFYNARSIWAYY